MYDRIRLCKSSYYPVSGTVNLSRNKLSGLEYADDVLLSEYSGELRLWGDINGDVVIFRMFCTLEA